MFDTFSLAPAHLVAGLADIGLARSIRVAREQALQNRDDVSSFRCSVADVTFDGSDPANLLSHTLKKICPDKNCNVLSSYAGANSGLAAVCWSIEGKIVTFINVEELDRQVTCTTWAEDYSFAKAVATDICDQFDVYEPKEEENLVPFTIWRGNVKGGCSYWHRDIHCPLPSEIQTNYPSWKEIDWLMNLPDPYSRGRIVIWTGDPGTGKTTAVRALAKQWFKNLDCSIEIVLDPENLLASAEYMHRVVMENNHLPYIRQQVERRYKNVKRTMQNQAKVANPNIANEHLRLVIIEDGAQYFGSGCRDQAGFARLLNVADGIVGQGLRTIFLITANENVGEMDPAIVRPGRCVQVLNFQKFDDVRARIWARERGFKWEAGRDATLAELFAEFNSWKVEHTDQKSFGFQSR